MKKRKKNFDVNRKKEMKVHNEMEKISKKINNITKHLANRYNLCYKYDIRREINEIKTPFSTKKTHRDN